MPANHLLSTPQTVESPHDDLRRISQDIMAASDHIVGILGGVDPKFQHRFDERLVRYARRYRSGQLRKEFIPSNAEARVKAKGIIAKTNALRAELHGLEAVNEFRRGYRHANGGKAGGQSSIEQMKRECERAGVAARVALQELKTRKGPQANEVLEGTISVLMALFERVTGDRALTTDRRDKIRCAYLKSPEALAIGRFFRAVDPNLEEKTIANMIAKVNRKYAGLPMREGNFCITALLEDNRGVWICFRDQPRLPG